MILHTNKGEIKINKLVSDIDFLPELCFECEVLSRDFETELRQQNNNISMEKYRYIILTLHDGSEEVNALYREGDCDETAKLPYCVSVELTVSETKSELKSFILSALEQCYFPV